MSGCQLYTAWVAHVDVEIFRVEPRKSNFDLAISAAKTCAIIMQIEVNALTPLKARRLRHAVCVTHSNCACRMPAGYISMDRLYLERGSYA